MVVGQPLGHPMRGLKQFCWATCKVTSLCSHVCRKLLTLADKQRLLQLTKAIGNAFGFSMADGASMTIASLFVG